MTHPKNLSITDFTYDLPTERIAKFPVEERDLSKLLVYRSGKICEFIYQNLDQFLTEKTLLIFNNTKVIEARLLFTKSTGGVIEIFCLEPDDECAEITTAMLQKEKIRWKCLIGGASKWKHGTKLKKMISKREGAMIVEAEIVGRVTDCFIIEFTWQPVELSFAEVLHLAGSIPLPPYLHREAEEEDKKRYQTIYAEYDGSVAAPTAGLHFTAKVFEKLAAKNIHVDFVTLHVGAGTFKPVKADRMLDHEMHAEFIDVSQNVIKNLIDHMDEPIVAVGTTSLRTIESLYWIGVKLICRPDTGIDEIALGQWEPYDITCPEIPAKDALHHVLGWMMKNEMSRLITKTQILIAPGYNLKVAKGIITNFHQPQSTLLLLVAAVIGERWRKIYRYALDNDFRFLSYGDGCLLWNRDSE